MQASRAAERHAEQRWPASIAIVIALALYALTPATIVPRDLLIGVAVLIFIPLFALNPHRLSRETTWSRWLSISLAVVLTVANQINVVSVVGTLLSGKAAGPAVLLTALQVWITNVVAFALVFWELDRGGPVSRGTLARELLPVADFKFPQDEDGDSVREVRLESSERADWRPGYIDYLYMSVTNMMAFSPTDVMPLTTRAKLLMMLQSMTGFVLLALVIARAVNIVA
jgi:uncharacterized membrane protein